MVNIFLDDLRKAPDGFLHVRSYDECVQALLDHNGSVNALCLDNNLGKGNKTGGDVAVWMIRNDIIFPKTIYIHTANFAERSFIYSVLNNHVTLHGLNCVVYKKPYPDVGA